MEITFSTLLSTKYSRDDWLDRVALWRTGPVVKFLADGWELDFSHCRRSVWVIIIKNGPGMVCTSLGKPFGSKCASALVRQAQWQVCSGLIPGLIRLNPRSTVCNPYEGAPYFILSNSSMPIRTIRAILPSLSLYACKGKFCALL